MANKTRIVFRLSPDSVGNAIKQIEDYKKTLIERCELLCKRLIELAKAEATTQINVSMLGSSVVLSTGLEHKQFGCRAVLMAVGQDKTNLNGTVNTLLLIEFGAGIHYNKQENPKAGEFGMGIGSFPNQKHAFEDGWYFMDENGEWVYSHGAKATMPMYNAGRVARRNLVKVAKECFK